MAEASTGQGVILSGDAVEAALQGCENISELCSAIDALYARVGRRFSVAMAEAVTTALQQALLGADEGEVAMVRSRAGRAAVGGAPVPLWARAGLLAATDEAAPAWDECVAALPQVVPEALLHRCRARLGAGDGAGAAADLRLALLQPAGYDLWTRAEKLQRRLPPDAIPTLRSIRLAVLGGRASTALLAPLLRLACFREGIAVELYEGDYDHWQQDILDPASGLYTFRPDVVLLTTHWRDAELPVHATDPEAAVAGVVQRWVGLWTALRERHPCTIIAHGFDLPDEDPYGRLGTALPGGRGAVLREVNAALAREAGADVLLLDLDRVAAEVGRADWCEPRRWHSARQHPGAAGLVPLVESQVALLRASLGLARKVVVLDLDNTLWGGVIGEDGLEGIALGPPSAAGEAYQTFQKYLKELRGRGIVLAVCSQEQPGRCAPAVRKPSGDGPRPGRLRRLRGQLGREGREHSPHLGEAISRARQLRVSRRQPGRAGLGARAATRRDRPGASRRSGRLHRRARAWTPLRGGRSFRGGSATARELPGGGRAPGATHRRLLSRGLSGEPGDGRPGRFFR